MKKNLVILGDALDRQRAGIYRMTYEMVNALSKYASDQFNIFLISNKEHKFEGEYELIKPNHKSVVPQSRLINYFYHYPRLAKTLNADFVLEPAHFGPFNLPKRIKRITFIHDLTPVLFPDLHKGLSASLQKRFLPGILKKAALILCPSDQTQKDIIQHYKTDTSKIHKIIPGSNHYLSQAPNRDILTSLGVNKPYFVHVGTIEPRKNLVFLIKAFEAYNAKADSQTQLLLVGQKGWQSEKIYEYASKSKFANDIIFTGYLQDEHLSSVYAYAKAHILTSLYEGFSLSAQDSLDLGIPTLLPNHSAFVDQVKSSATYYELNDLENLVDKMSNSIGSNNQSMPLRSWEPTIYNFIEKLNVCV